MAENFAFLNKEYLLPLINQLPWVLYRCRNDDLWSMEMLSDGCKNLIGFEKEDLIDNKILSYSDLIIDEDKEKVRKKVNEAIKEKNQSCSRILQRKRRDSVLRTRFTTNS